jgi:CheY-like chemotaxis protein
MNTLIPRVQFEGDAQHIEFAEVLAWMQQHTLLDALQPQWLLWFQSRPGQVSQGEIEQAHRQYPLARIVLILGSWCEGELRSGQPCHGVERCFWYEAIPHLSRLWSQPCEPRTASLAERCDQQTRWRTPLPTLRIAIAAKTRAGAESLTEAIQALQQQVSPITEEESNPSDFTPELCLLDGEDTRDSWLLPTVRALRNRWPTVPSIACFNFPRSHECEEIRALGVNAVLGKPFWLADLACLIKSVAALHASGRQ